MRIKEAIKAFVQSFSSPEVSSTRIRFVLLFSLFIYAALLIALAFAWYSRQWATSGFHFFNDAAEWKQMDKFAHCFWSFQISAIVTRLLLWTRLPDRTAFITGTLLGFLFVSSIEIPDGFSSDYGASIFDILANLAGCTIFLGQRLWLGKINLWPKVSFHPTVFAPLRPAMLGDGLLEEILKDYNGQTFWYSLNLKFLRMPSWLAIAVGVGAEGMLYGRDYQNEMVNLSPYRKYFLSIDINPAGIKTSSRFARMLLSVFTIIKLPAPTLEFSTKGIRFHPIYF